MVNWIIGDLGICSLNETLDAIKNEHIGAILVDVRDLTDGKNINTKRIKAYLRTIKELREKGFRVIIRCHAGISRSVALAIGILMLQHNLSYEDSYDIVRKQMPQANPNLDLLDQIKELVLELKREKTICP